MIKDLITRSMILWGAAALIGFSLYTQLEKKVFPSSIVSVKLNKAQAIERSNEFLQKHGFSSAGYEKVVIFEACSTAYLQETEGTEATITILQKELPCWAWEVRYFIENQIEGFYTSVDPMTGRVTRFSHNLLDEDPGKSPSKEEALVLAQRFLHEFGGNPAKLQLLDSSQESLPKRVDHNFVWKNTSLVLKEADVRTEVSLLGETLGYFAKYLHVPEDYYKKQFQKSIPRQWITIFLSIAMILVFIAAFIVLLRFYKIGTVKWRMALTFAGIIVLILCLNFFNELPSLWFAYPSNTPKIIYLGFAFVGVLFGSLFMGLVVFLFCAAGEALSRQVGTPAFRMLELDKRELFHVQMVGTSLGIMMMGYVALFYLIAARIFGINMPIDFSAPPLLDSAMPFLYPLTVAASAAISEEFVFRLFSITFFKKIFKSTWIAVLLSSVLWALGHTDTLVSLPYSRTIELTLVGIALGTVYLRYGIEASILAHYVYNSLVAGWPLLVSENNYYRASAFIITLLAFLPAVLVLFIKSKVKSGHT